MYSTLLTTNLKLFRKITSNMQNILESRAKIMRGFYSRPGQESWSGKGGKGRMREGREWKEQVRL